MQVRMWNKRNFHSLMIGCKMVLLLFRGCFPVVFLMLHFNFFIQYYFVISFRCISQWLGNHIFYKVVQSL